MAYEEDSSCPQGYNRRLLSLLFETVWYTPDFEDKWSQAKNPDQPFILSTDDTKGYSLHADFMSGWKEEELGKALEECTMDAFAPSDCPYLDVDDSSGDCYRVSSRCITHLVKFVLLSGFPSQGADVSELVQTESSQPGPVLKGLPGQSEAYDKSANVKLCKNPDVWQGEEKAFTGCTNGTEDPEEDEDDESEEDQSEATTAGSSASSAREAESARSSAQENSTTRQDDVQDDSDEDNQINSLSGISATVQIATDQSSKEGTSVDSSSCSVILGPVGVIWVLGITAVHWYV